MSNEAPELPSEIAARLPLEERRFRLVVAALSACADGRQQASRFLCAEAADALTAQAARIAELEGALRDMRDDRAGFRHPAHFRRRAAVVLQGSRAALGETPTPPTTEDTP
jgi:hypothetical protein